MTKFKHTGTVRGVTPMDKTPLQNLPKSWWQKIGVSVNAGEAREAFRASYHEIFNLAETELRIMAVFHDEIVSEVKK